MSDRAVAEVIEHAALVPLGQLPPIDGGKLPRGAELGSYLTRIDAGTSRRLGSTSLANRIALNVDASLVASTKLVEWEPGTPVYINRCGLSLLFQHNDIAT